MSDRGVSDGRGGAEKATGRTNPEQRGRGISVAVVGLGAWLLVGTLLFDLPAGPLWNDLLVGAALIGLGGYNFYRRTEERFGSVAVGAFTALLGLWTLVAPFVFDPNAGVQSTGPALWNAVVVGALVSLLGFYSAVEARRSDTGRPAKQR